MASSARQVRKKRMLASVIAIVRAEDPYGAKLLLLCARALETRTELRSCTRCVPLEAYSAPWIDLVDFFLKLILKSAHRQGREKQDCIPNSYGSVPALARKRAASLLSNLDKLGSTTLYLTLGKMS